MVWQEPWADRGWKGWDEGWFVVTFLTWGSAVFGLVIAISVFTRIPLKEYYRMILFFLALVSGLAVTLVNMRSRLPNRVYEVGFTFYPSRLWWHDVSEEDHFVPFENVTRITVERNKRWVDRGVLRVELRDGPPLGGRIRIERYLPPYIEALRDQNQEVKLVGLDYLGIQEE